MINIICDRALLGAYAHERDRVDAATVRRAGREVFGRVTEGMDVVDAIAAVQTRPDDSPVTPVVITRAYVRAAAPAKPAS